MSLTKVPTWDCIGRDQLRAWIADMRSRPGYEDGYDTALNDLEALVNKTKPQDEWDGSE